MQGNVFDIKKFAVHDGSGIRTTVFLKGCPLRCTWCHNPESQSLQPEEIPGLSRRKVIRWLKQDDGKVGKEVSAQTVANEVTKDLLFFEESGGGVTFSGGEPLVQVDFLLQLLKKCKNVDINTTVDTCGYASSSSFQKIIPFTDTILYDLKLIDDESHIYYTGVSNQLIKENFIHLSNESVDLRVRIPLIPDITDTNDNLLDIINFLKKNTEIRKVELLPFNILSPDKYRKMDLSFDIHEKRKRSVEKLSKIEELIRQNGFTVRIEG